MLVLQHHSRRRCKPSGSVLKRALGKRPGCCEGVATVKEQERQAKNKKGRHCCLPLNFVTVRIDFPRMQDVPGYPFRPVIRTSPSVTKLPFDVVSHTLPRTLLSGANNPLRWLERPSGRVLLASLPRHSSHIYYTHSPDVAWEFSDRKSHAKCHRSKLCSFAPSVISTDKVEVALYCSGMNCSVFSSLVPAEVCSMTPVPR